MRILRNRVALALVATASIYPALAAPPQSAPRIDQDARMVFSRGGEMPLEVEIAKSDDGERYVGSFRVRSKSGCEGDVVLMGTRLNKYEFLFARRDENSGLSCNIRVRITRSGAARIGEDECSDYHGASCSFEGTAPRRH